MEQDNYNFRGWINSDKFFKRAIAISIYAAVGTLVIRVAILIIGLLLGLLGFTTLKGQSEFWPLLKTTFEVFRQSYR